MAARHASNRRWERITRTSGNGNGGGNNGNNGGGVGVSGSSFTSHGETVNDTTPNLTGISFGTPKANRNIIMITAYNASNAGSDYTAATIGGISATEIVEAAASGGTNAAIHIANVPTGTTGDVDITVSSPAALMDAAFSLIRVVGFSTTASNTNAGLVGGTSISKTIDCPAGGMIVAGCYRDGGSGITWTNVDELDDYAWDTNQKGLSTASKIYATQQTGLTITAAKTEGGGAIALYMVVASFAAA